ncbi:MAG: hypothetical protein MUF10_12520 [Thermoanaerobaculaceae bacterium]|jgi:predicted transcriptional regulator|nr:hypothetical protein [Thermoanaerobaculaceae bacterium]
MSVTIRIAEHTHRVLSDLARQEGRSLQATVEQAVEAYRRQRLLAEANAAYARLRSKPAGWREEVEEREGWDVTLLDGLEEGS